MSHKSGHIIVNSLISIPTVTLSQQTKLKEIEQRDEYNFADKMYLSMLVMSVADDPSEKDDD